MNKTFKAIESLKRAMSDEDISSVSVNRYRDRNPEDGTFLPDRFSVNIHKADPWPWRRNNCDDVDC